MTSALSSISAKTPTSPKPESSGTKAAFDFIHKLIVQQNREDTSFEEQSKSFEIDASLLSYQDRMTGRTLIMYAAVKGNVAALNFLTGKCSLQHFQQMDKSGSTALGNARLCLRTMGGINTSLVPQYEKCIAILNEREKELTSITSQEEKGDSKKSTTVHEVFSVIKNEIDKKDPTEALSKLMKQNKDLYKEKNEDEMTPIVYAARLGCLRTIEFFCKVAHLDMSHDLQYARKIVRTEKARTDAENIKLKIIYMTLDKKIKELKNKFFHDIKRSLRAEESEDWQIVTTVGFCKALKDHPTLFIDFFDVEHIFEQCNVKYRDRAGRTMLHHAAMNGKMNCLLRLIKNEKVRINCLDNKGKTPLDYYAEFSVNAECNLVDALLLKDKGFKFSKELDPEKLDLFITRAIELFLSKNKGPLQPEVVAEHLEKTYQKSWPIERIKDFLEERNIYFDAVD